MANIAQNFLILSFKSNYVPLFFENGELLRKMRIVDYDRNTIVLEKIPDDEVGHAYVRPIKSGGLMAGVRLDINVKGLDIETPRMVSLEPIPGGLKVHINKAPDPGREPTVTPIMIRRKFFKVPKTIAGKPSSRRMIRVFLMSRQIRHVILANRFTALSHVGGAMFVFVRNPLEYRAPYLPIIYKRGAKEIVYTNIPVQLGIQIGLEGLRIACYDFIQSVDGRFFLRLVDEAEAQKGQRQRR